MINGDYNKPEWKDAESIFLVDTVTGKEPRQGTECKLLWDDTYLYVLFVCKDDFINAVMTDFNDLIYDEEVVEIFLDDNCDLKTYIEIEVNPLNTQLHYCIYNDLKGDTVAYAKVEQSIISEVVDNRKDNIWSVEMAIPFSEFKTAPNIPPKNLDSWRMNLYRIDRSENDEDEYTAWQPTGKIDYHMPEKFGQLIFVE